MRPGLWLRWLCWMYAVCPKHGLKVRLLGRHYCLPCADVEARIRDAKKRAKADAQKAARMTIWEQVIRET